MLVGVYPLPSAKSIPIKFVKMRVMKRILLGVLAVSLWASGVYAETYSIDPAHSNVNFSIRHLVGHVTGHFDKFEGAFDYDAKSPAAWKAAASIDAASINTGIQKRDDHLRSADFFDVARFPRILFASERVAPAAGKVVVTGRLTLRGVSREVSVPVEVEVGEKALRARGEFVIRMSDYGISYRSFMNPIRDEVTIVFDLRGMADGPPDV